MKYERTFLKYVKQVKEIYDRDVENGWLPKLSLAFAFYEIANEMFKELDKSATIISDEELDKLFKEGGDKNERTNIEEIN